MSHASIFSTERDGRAVSEHRHEVQFYESSAFLSSVVARYLADGFRHDNPMVVIARPEHRTAFRTELKSQGFDVDAAISRGQFNEYDAEETLNKFMDGQLPNRERFSLVIGQVIDECRKGHEDLPVLAYGEMVDILWRNDKCEAAILLEELWNELAESEGLNCFAPTLSMVFIKRLTTLTLSEFVRPIRAFTRLKNGWT